VGWSRPAAQPHTAARSLPSRGKRERGGKWKGKNEKTRGLRYRQFNRQSKGHTCKQSKTRNPFTTPHGRAAVQPSPGQQGSITRNGYLGRQTPSLRTPACPPLPPSSPQLLMLSMTSYGMGDPLGQMGPAVQLCLLPASPAPPVYSTRWRGNVRRRKGLDAV